MQKNDDVNLTKNKRLVNFKNNYIVDNNQLHVSACSKTIVRLHMRMTKTKSKAVIHASQDVTLLYHLEIV